MSGEEAIQHKKTHSENSFKCNVCGESFLQVTKLLKHVDGEQHVSLLCGICQFEAGDESEMLDHLDCHRTPGRPFSCQYCQSKFRSKRELGLHVLKHTDQAPYVCNICQKGFKWKQVLKMHMMTHSTDVFFVSHLWFLLQTQIYHGHPSEPTFRSKFFLP